MRKSELEITDRAEIEEILRQATVVHVGMADAGRPYVVPMNFGYAGGCLYLHSGAEGRKIDVLKRNPLVCFEVDANVEVVPGKAPCRFGMKYRSVIGYGKATFIEDAQGKIEAFNVMMPKFRPGPYEYGEDPLARAVVIRIDIDSMTGKRAGF